MPKDEKIKPNIRMKELRAKVDVSQEQAAKMMGVSRDTISRWETGARATPQRMMKQFLTKVVGRIMEDAYQARLKEELKAIQTNINDLV